MPLSFNRTRGDGGLKTGLFISLLNPAIAIVIACAFLGLWLYQRQRRHLAVLAFGYVASAAGFLLQYFTLPVGLPVSRLFSVTCFTTAIFCIAGAAVASCGKKAPYATMAALCGAGLAVFCWFMFVTPDLTARLYAINIAFGGVSLAVAARLRTAANRGPLEKILFALSLVSAVNLLVRPVLIISVEGSYASYDGFYDSLYWTTSMLCHAVVSLLIAFTLLASAASDMMRDLRAETNTDPLSGLLNRRGFERAAAEALSRQARLNIPAAMVIADLDHFKAVNDSFGHAVGDKVIVAFAERLRSAAPRGAILGRLGGEEFVVLLTACDLAAARLFAEGVRLSFSTASLPGVPDRLKVTASFGVASLSGTEDLSELLGRADSALYNAKRAGRDRVRLSYQHVAEPVHAVAAAAG
jgi:diguanylate cyclase (GGDEF)-like protein